MSDTPWREAIIQVLRRSGQPMSYTEIAETIIAEELRQSVGATPANTVAANISTSIYREGQSSPFVRIARGEYGLREFYQEHPPGAPRGTLEEPEADDDTPIIGAFGMYWERSLVDWNARPKLLGSQGIGATTVDFFEQRGLYLLHDRRQIIYVGRSTDRPLGKRLYEHTQDRLRGRWDRFSWFGIRGVTEEGQLQPPRDGADIELCIQAIEALLIESIEPPQNRKRGDGFSGIEYIQSEDPALRDRKLMNELKSRLEQ